MADCALDLASMKILAAKSSAKYLKAGTPQNNRKNGRLFFILDFDYL